MISHISRTWWPLVVIHTALIKYSSAYVCCEILVNWSFYFLFCDLANNPFCPHMVESLISKSHWLTFSYSKILPWWPHLEHLTPLEDKLYLRNKIGLGMVRSEEAEERRKEWSVGSQSICLDKSHLNYLSKKKKINKALLHITFSMVNKK